EHDAGDAVQREIDRRRKPDWPGANNYHRPMLAASSRQLWRLVDLERFVIVARHALTLQRVPHRLVALDRPDARRVDAERLVIGARDIERQTMFVDRVAREFLVALGAAGGHRVLQRSTAHRDLSRRLV